MFGFIFSLLIGALAGSIAGRIMGSETSALRNIVRIYPYDVAENIDTTGDGIADEGSLRGSSEVVAERIRQEIQQKVEEAGLEIIEARITYLAYAPEIAAAMLQRQQDRGKAVFAEGAGRNMQGVLLFF